MKAEHIQPALERNKHSGGKFDILKPLKEFGLQIVARIFAWSDSKEWSDSKDRSKNRVK